MDRLLGVTSRETLAGNRYHSVFSLLVLTDYYPEAVKGGSLINNEKPRLLKIKNQPIRGKRYGIHQSTIRV